MNILSINVGGPIPEINGPEINGRYPNSMHPQKYLESLGVRILEWHGSSFGSLISVEVDHIPDNLPKFITVSDDWPEWAKEQRELGVSSDAF